MGEKVPGVRYDFAAFESDVVSIMEKHILGKTLQEVDVQSYFSDLVAGAIRHQIRMPATYTMVFKALMTVEGIGKVLAPEINFLDETRPFIQEILVERYSPKRILREASDVLGNFGRLTRQFTQSAPQILRDLEQGNTGVKSEILGLKSLAEEQRRLLKMQTRGNLTAAAFIAGAILYDIPGTSILGMSIPTFIMFIVGGLTGFPLIFSMLRRTDRLTLNSPENSKPRLSSNRLSTLYFFYFAFLGSHGPYISAILKAKGLSASEPLCSWALYHS